MIFGVLNPEKIWHQQLVHLPTSPVATLPWEIQKIIFQQYYSFIHPISYVISQKNANCYFLSHYTSEVGKRTSYWCQIFSGFDR